MKTITSLVCALALGVLVACLKKDVAGTSSGTENPEVVLSFVQDGKSVAFTGTIALYESMSVPLQSEPLIQERVESAVSTILSLESLPPVESAFSDTSAESEEPEFEYTLVVDGDGHGAVVSQLKFGLARVFRHQDELIGDTLQVVLTHKLTAATHVSWPVQNDEPNYVYIPGTPYYAPVIDGGASWKPVPKGDYRARVISVGQFSYPVTNTFTPGTTANLEVDDEPIPLDSLLKLYKVAFGPPARVQSPQDLCFLAYTEDPQVYLKETVPTAVLPSAESTDILLSVAERDLSGPGMDKSMFCLFALPRFMPYRKSGGGACNVSPTIVDHLRQYGEMVVEPFHFVFTGVAREQYPLLTELLLVRDTVWVGETYP